jgi:predicted PurR-regulated permease PerM
MDIDRRDLRDKAFLLLLVVASLAFAWIVMPFYGAILWGIVIAILFAPVYRRLLNAMKGRRSLAAAATVVIIVAIVILPMTLIGASLAQQAAGVIGKVKSGELDLVRNFQTFLELLPAWVTSLLERFGLTSLSGVREQVSAGVMKFSELIAAQALSLG